MTYQVRSKANVFQFTLFTQSNAELTSKKGMAKISGPIIPRVNDTKWINIKNSIYTFHK